jgi:adenylyl cyclase-associated protein
MKPSKPQALAGKKPPKFVLDGTKWMIVSFFLQGNILILLISNVQENQENETLTLEDVTLSQSVNIFACKGTTIVIKGKVNAVSMREYEGHRIISLNWFFYFI